jgi:hypothetical protein
MGTVDTRPEEGVRVCTVASRRLLCLAALSLSNREIPIYETSCALTYQVHVGERSLCTCMQNKRALYFTSKSLASPGRSHNNGRLVRYSHPRLHRPEFPEPNDRIQRQHHHIWVDLIGQQVEVQPEAETAIQIHAVTRNRRLGRSALRHRTCSPSIPATAPSNLVFQHCSRGNGDGDCRIRVPHPIEPAKPLLCDLVRGSGTIKSLAPNRLFTLGRARLTVFITVLLHRRCAGVLLGGNLLARFRRDHHLRARIRADAAEARPLYLHRVRRRGDNNSDCRRDFGGSGVFQPGGPDNTQQDSFGRPRLPSFFVCRLPGRVVLDSDKGQ